MARKVIGAAELSKRFRAIPKAVKDAATKSAMTNGRKMAGDMRRLVPVDTGKLRDSIIVTGPGEQIPSYAGMGAGGRVPETAVAVTAGNSGARHGHLVEFGTSKMQPQPFFTPVVRMSKRKATRAIKSAISRAIKKAK